MGLGPMLVYSKNFGVRRLWEVRLYLNAYIAINPFLQFPFKLLPMSPEVTTSKYYVKLIAAVTI